MHNKSTQVGVCYTLNHCHVKTTNSMTINWPDAKVCYNLSCNLVMSFDNVNCRSLIILWFMKRNLKLLSSPAQWMVLYFWWLPALQLPMHRLKGKFWPVTWKRAPIRGYLSIVRTAFASHYATFTSDYRAFLVSWDRYCRVPPLQGLLVFSGVRTVVEGLDARSSHNAKEDH